MQWIFRSECDSLPERLLVPLALALALAQPLPKEKRLVGGASRREEQPRLWRYVVEVRQQLDEWKYVKSRSILGRAGNFILRSR
jgi:hypothetical protein